MCRPDWKYNAHGAGRPIPRPPRVGAMKPGKPPHDSARLSTSWLVASGPSCRHTPYTRPRPFRTNSKDVPACIDAEPPSQGEAAVRCSLCKPDACDTDQQ